MDLEVLVRPGAEGAARAVRAGLSQGRVVVIAGLCTVTYEGRARSTLSEGERIVICKPDGAVMVHRPTGLEAVNWNPPGSIASIHVEEGRAKLVSMRRRPPERLVVDMLRVDLVASMRMVDEGVFSMYASEDEMKMAVRVRPSLIEEGFRLIDLERPIDPSAGYADVVGEDREGNLVVVELKRVTAGREAVVQLKRYVDALSSRTSRRVRGIIAAPSITRDGLRLAEQLGFKYVKLSPEECHRVLERHEGGAKLLDYV